LIEQVQEIARSKSVALYHQQLQGGNVTWSSHTTFHESPPDALIAADPLSNWRNFGAHAAPVGILSGLK
jgi:hypothetical protein